MKVMGLSALVALAMMSAGANAAQIIVKSAIAPLTAGQFSITLDVDQFDPTQGVLTSIEVFLYTNYIASASTTFDQTADKAIHTTSFNLMTELTDQSGDLDLVQRYNKSASASGCGNDCIFGPGDSPQQTISVSGRGQLSQTTTLTNVAQFLPYVGLGQIEFSLNGTSFASQEGNARVGGQAQIIYNFDAIVPPVVLPTSSVPEPASWALMLAGFGATGVALRRGTRRKTAFA